MVTAVIRQPGAARPAATTARESMRARFPARPVPASWPATLQPRDTVWERLNRVPFVLDNAKSQQRRVRGLALLLDWLAAQPGQTWQERWLASGADRAGAGWRQLPAACLHRRGLQIRYQPPQATYLAWLDCRALGLHDADTATGSHVVGDLADPARMLLDRARVAVSSGHVFGQGGAGYVRLNFATSPAILRQAIQRMGNAARAQH